MESPFDVSALTAITGGGGASRSVVAALKSNLEQVGKISASPGADAIASPEVRPSDTDHSPTLVFSAIRSASHSGPLAELDKLAKRGEENRARIEENIRTLAASIASVQRSRSFVSNLTTRSVTPDRT